MLLHQEQEVSQLLRLAVVLQVRVCVCLDV